MIICPTCGAGNKDESTVCRMCAGSLEAARPVVNAREENALTFPPTVIMAEHKPDQPAADPDDSGEVVCSKCQTVNEAGWSFCQQCGNRLSKPSPPEPPPESGRPDSGRPDSGHKSPEGFRTVPSEKPSIEAKGAESKSAQQGLKTVVAQPAASTKPEKPASPPAQASEQQPPAQHSPAQHSPAQRPSPPPKKPNPQVGSPTVADEPPTRKPSLPGDEKPEAPAFIKSPPPTEQVRSIGSVPAEGEITCPQCGHNNGGGSAFCASCGSVLTVARTVVMSSPIVPVKGRLHLVMEGGQSGDTYEIDEETIIGRASGDITFPHDGFMSGRHARIIRRDNKFMLTDEGSRNGTFVKIKGEVELKPGDMILVGKQLFRFEV
jgi:FHA domain/Double zinc ribbon